MSNELYHYGVKGMKWKDHKYKVLKNGRYVYDVVRYNTTFQGIRDKKAAREYEKYADSDKRRFDIAKTSKRGDFLQRMIDYNQQYKRDKNSADAYIARYNKYSLRAISKRALENGKTKTNLVLKKKRISDHSKSRARYDRR